MKITFRWQAGLVCDGKAWMGIIVKILAITMKYLPVCFLLLTACTSAPTPPIATEPEPEPIVQEYVGRPTARACNRPFVAVDLESYQQCVLEGMSYVMVANILGYAGNPAAEGGGRKIVQWNGPGGGFMTVVFENDRVVSKSQSGLESCQYRAIC